MASARPVGEDRDAGWLLASSRAHRCRLRSLILLAKPQATRRRARCVAWLATERRTCSCKFEMAPRMFPARPRSHPFRAQRGCRLDRNRRRGCPACDRGSLSSASSWCFSRIVLSEVSNLRPLDAGFLPELAGRPAQLQTPAAACRSRKCVYMCVYIYIYI